MSIERVGYLGYKLYHLGWQNAVHKNLNPIEHSLFNALLYYRRGFNEGSAFVKANRTYALTESESYGVNEQRLEEDFQ